MPEEAVAPLVRRYCCVETGNLVDEKRYSQRADAEGCYRTHQGEVDLETAAKFPILSHEAPPTNPTQEMPVRWGMQMRALAVSMP